MSDVLPYIFIGLASGSVYALAGVGLVLTYKTSGIFNFAHGALGTAAAYVFYTLHVQVGLPWPVAALIAVAVLGPLLGIGFEWFGRGLSRTPMVWRIVATVGVLISIQGLFTVIYGPNSLPFEHFLPVSTFSVFGANVTWEQLIIAVTALVATFGLWVFFRVSRVGIAMRAVVDDPENLSITGTSPALVRRWAWVIGCAFATLSGLLLAPSVGLEPTVLTMLVVQAFGAAAVGGFSSLPWTYLGGIAIGIGTSVISMYSGGLGSVLGGVPASLPFLVLFLVLLLAPRSKLSTKEVAVRRRPLTWQAPARAQLVLGVVLVGLLATVPAFAGVALSQWTLMLTQVILFLSLGLLVRSAGQVSLCQVTFAGIGAVAFSRLTTEAGLPWLLALVLAGLVCVPVGMVLAIPAIRHSGLYLALATFGFAVLVEKMLYQTDWMFHADGSGVDVPTPAGGWLSTTTGYYYLVLAITVVIAVAVLAVINGRLGRLLSGISDSPLALSAQGVSITVTLVLVFCLSAFLAGVSGALSGAVLGTVTGGNYAPFTSLVIVATLMIAIGRTPWYGIAAAVPLALGPVYIPGKGVEEYLHLLFGVAAVIVALRGQVPWPAAQRAIDRVFGRRPRHPEHPVTVDAAQAPQELPELYRAGRAPLTAADVRVRYGGLVAVRDVSLQVEPGKITGLIGPNGAGKTSMLNVCSGLVRPAGGALAFGGKPLAGKGIAARARLGIGRSFQQIELFETLTVRENLALGGEGAMAGAGVLSQVLVTPGERRALEGQVATAAARVGLAELLDVQVSALSTGQRRLVEFGRCLVGPFGTLLLDEPSSGLDHIETAEFGTVLREVVDERGLGVLLVEHDMELVMGVCDVIYVMEFGSIIFTGTPAEVRQSAAVRAAYLGSPDEDVHGEPVLAVGEAVAR